METYLECLPCMVNQALEGARHSTEDVRIQQEVLRAFMRLAAEADLQESSPRLIGIVHRVIRELTGNPDPYSEAKDRLNRMALDHYERFKEMVSASLDPLGTAVRLAITGNALDFVVNAEADQSDIGAAAQRCLTIPLDDGSLKEFQRAAESARRILYLGDNAGEIVLDRLLIEQLPAEKITFVVKGSPVVNDVTRSDAVAVGIADLVEVVDNGSDMPGTILKDCSDSFLRRFREADLIISKGQGNYESLSDEDANIFFLFQAKCRVITLHLGYAVGSLVLLGGRAAPQP
jgi:damage-control phosphatase, subfamily I